MCLSLCVWLCVCLYLSLCVVCQCVCVCDCVLCIFACYIFSINYQVEIKLIWLRDDPDAVPMDATFIECMMGVYKPCFDKPYASTKINNYQFNSIPTMMVMSVQYVY